MTSIQTTAEVFWTAFRALPKKEREAFMARLYSDRRYREDLIDLALIKQRQKEPSKSLKTYSDGQKERSLMPFSVFLKRSAEKELDNLPPSIHDRVVSKLLPLRDQSRPPGAIKLKGREA